MTGWRDRRERRDGEDERRGAVSSAWRKISGRDELERALKERYEPYGYESNANLVRWLTGGLLVWILVMVGLILHGQATASMLSDWQDKGFTKAAPESPIPVEIFTFAEEQGLECSTVEDILAAYPDCELILEFGEDVKSAEDRGTWLAIAVVALLGALAFTFSLFTHRASRNLLPLKAEGQRFSPEWAVACFFIPVINLWRPFQVYVELFRASGPYRLGENPEAWKRSPPSAGPVLLWWMSILGALAFNPISLNFAVADTGLADAVQAFRTDIWAEIWLMVPALAAIWVVHALHRKQEARYAQVGPNLVTRPEPDPFGLGQL